MAQPTGASQEQMRQMQQQFFAEAAKQGMTPEQFQEHQRQQLAADAAKQGLSVEQYVNQLKQRAMQEHQMKQQAQQKQAQGQMQGQAHQHQHQHPQSQKVPVNPNAPPKPEALAVAKFLRSQDLKSRTCILDGQRKEMFKGKKTVPYTLNHTYATSLSQAGIPSTTVTGLRASAKEEQFSSGS